MGKTEMNIPFVRTFSDVPLKKPLIYIDSRGNVALAVNQGSFAATYSIKPPVPIVFSRPQSNRYQRPSGARPSFGLGMSFVVLVATNAHDGTEFSALPNSRFLGCARCASLRSE